MPTHFPVQSMRPMPTGKPLTLPKIQASFGKEGGKDREIRLKRQQAVKSSLKRCWKAYGKHAWLEDELTPVSGSSRNTFGGWGATLVDSLDTLWIMGLQEEFEQAATAAVAINFETSTFEEVNAFETTIRYLGGFLAAYDLSGDTRLLRKAREVGDMLYKAFDTPNRMPMPRWNFAKALANTAGEAPLRALVAEIGSLCMEFTRLSLVTGNPKWFDATERITDALKSQQNETQLPGMWPITVNPFKMKFTDDNTFSLGARADSTFEYLPKMVALTGGLLPDYAGMYEDAMKTAIKYNLYRPMVPDEADILIAGSVHTSEQDGEIVTALESEGQHLVCYAGGMLAIGSKLLNIPDHLETARKLVDGCIWTYKSMPLGIMPETFFMDPCESQSKCPWDEVRWKTAVLLHHKKSGDLTQADELISKNRLPKGFTSIPDTRYILRPEAIESIFVLYRVTGKKDLLESAWAIFQSIQKYTETDLANSALKDVTIANGDPLKMDSMESFWMGETLKYFYLIFSEPDLISLDEFVFNTEAHPLRRLGA
ncbi:glycoside hydrolase [Pseudomassariella vexata]|uniref:alpha-1,2-Mannosidase n=1 Tax=Pseudomassariella vexata TaxID=1141098 RepID=A0A1Y2E4V9_9PEZI|nr:glycoside hydrolase [Pseudomassariella vexata]ORY65895.1 glycoside hydrolase [Pseudomassariella vexata]